MRIQFANPSKVPPLVSVHGAAMSFAQVSDVAAKLHAPQKREAAH